jgi:hypothetical protein
VYTGVADIVDTNHIVIKPIRKYTYANVYDADGQSPYLTDDYTPSGTEVKISGKNIIVIFRKFNIVFVVLCL